MRLALLTLVALALPRPAAAHPAPFSYIDIRIVAAGIDGSLVLHDFDVAHDVGVDPPERLTDATVAALHRDELMRLMDSRVAILRDGVRATLSWTGFEVLAERQSIKLTFHADGPRPGSIRVDTVVFPYDPVHQTFVNFYEGRALRHQAILDATRHAVDYYAGTWQGTAAVLGVFIPAGIEHILIGPDHLLFLIGLLLPGGSILRLATIVTAFTIGHSLTLSLAALDVVSPPASIVEPAIALSIVFVGVDNLLVQRDANAMTAGAARRAPRDIRAWVAAAFGLVHGFGFASVLKELGLPTTALGWSLFSFNAGVEVGQLAVVLAVASALAWVQRRNAALNRGLVLTGSVLVALAGGYWFVQRVFFVRGL